MSSFDVAEILHDEFFGLAAALGFYLLEGHVGCIYQLLICLFNPIISSCLPFVGFVSIVNNPYRE